MIFSTILFIQVFTKLLVFCLIKNNHINTMIGSMKLKVGNNTV